MEATRRIRALPGREHLPILAMTANAMAGDRERSLAGGMNDHVTKPIDPEELFTVLLRWLPDRVADDPAVGENVADAPTPPLPPADLGLDRIPGLDTAAGMRRVLGRREAYVGLLRRFAAGQAGAMRDIRTALADGRRDEAERGAHTLKGVAGTIGAGQLQREAGEVEVALRRGAPAEEVVPLLNPAERTLDHLTTALLSALPAESQVASAPSSVDSAALAVTVAALEQLLSSDTAEAIYAFEAAKPILAAAFGDRSEQIGKLVRGYRFEDALAALREMVSG
jgi:CheY-like chemotaxis protein